MIQIKDGKGKYTGVSHSMYFAKRKGIKNPNQLTLEQLRDGLNFSWIRDMALRKSAKGLRKVHLCDCLIEAKESDNKKRERGVKQKIEWEYSKCVWYMFKHTTKDSCSPAVLEV